MELDDKQKREICVLILEKYGIQMDVNNEFLPLYHLAYTSSIISQEAIKRASDDIFQIVSEFERKTASKIRNIETKKFSFQDKWESFWFAFGAYGLPIIVGTIIVSSIVTTIWYLNKKDVDIEQNSIAVNSFFRNLEISNKRLDERTAVHSIKLYSSPNLKTSIAGKNYVYNSKCDCIEVPLYYKTTPPPSF